MDYEKKYKEIVGQLKKAYLYAQTDSTKAVLEEILPELAESEDDKIRKELLDFCKSKAEKYPNDPKYKNISAWITWLEKQGDKDKFIEKELGCIKGYRENAIKRLEELEKQGGQNDSDVKDYNNIDPHFGKSVDKIKPKFRVGDWVVLTAGELSSTLQIVNVDTNKKLYWFNDNSYLPIVDEECLHLWTLEDAKDGDVLIIGDIIIIFKELVSSVTCECYCSLCENEFGITKAGVYSCCGAKPATKEQRDILFAKMKEAGYEWNPEKKELKKVEDKLAEEYNGEDYGIDGLYHAQRILEKTLGSVDGYQTDDGILSHKCAITAVSKLSEQKTTIIISNFRVGDNIKTTNEEPLTITKIDEKGYWSEDLFICDFGDAAKWELVEQKPAEWSEEDEHGFENCLYAIKEIFKGVDNPHRVGTINWLKSRLKYFRPQNHWKPSEEQLKQLGTAVSKGRAGYFNNDVLRELYVQLKQL